MADIKMTCGYCGKPVPGPHVVEGRVIVCLLCADGGHQRPQPSSVPPHLRGKLETKPGRPERETK